MKVTNTRFTQMDHSELISAKVQSALRPLGWAYISLESKTSFFSSHLRKISG